MGHCGYELNRLSLNPKGVLGDWSLFARVLSDWEPAFDVRNLYIGCHTTERSIGLLPIDALNSLVRRRYHFGLHSRICGSKW
jgi:hypothetical protein